MPLNNRALQLLDFERDWWTHAGRKPDAIRARFGLDEDDYQAQLDQVIHTDDALAHDRMLVLRLRRLSAQAARRRANADTRPATSRSATPLTDRMTAGTCARCGTGWPVHQINLRGVGPCCLWGAA